MKKLSLVLATAFIFSTISAFALAADLPFHLALGDVVATVQKKLDTKMEPEPMARNAALPATAFDINKGKTVLHLRTKGVWTFFDRDGKLETIRLDAPFDGDVKGIKVGDDEKKLTATLGKPITKPTSVFMTLQAYRYVLDDSAYVTFDLNDDGVQFIFITK